MTTALDQINGACKLLGVLAAGETLSAEDSNDALEFFQQLLDSWTNEDLMVYASTSQEVTWAANERTRTIGPTGDIVALRPVSVDGRTFFTDTQSNSYPITLISEEEYNSISLKTTTSTYPEYMFINYTVPNITAKVYPVPTDVMTWTFVSSTELPQPTGLDTTLSFPPGYNRAFKYNLAVEIAPIFGIQPSPTVIRTAMSSKRVLKRANQRMEDLRMKLPEDLPTGYGGGNIFSGV